MTDKKEPRDEFNKVAIEKLEKLIDSHPVVGFVTLLNPDNKPDYFLIGDDATIDSFN